MKEPTRQETGLGYWYYRCRAGDDDSTVYEHQLVAILGGADPYRVFSDEFDVHHVDHCPHHNVPKNLALEDSEAHRTAHLEGRSPPTRCGSIDTEAAAAAGAEDGRPVRADGGEPVDE